MLQSIKGTLPMVLAAGFWLSTGSHADQITFTQSYVSGLRDSNVATFVASCNEKDGKMVFVVAIGHSDGMLLEYEGSELINPSTIKLARRTLLIDQTNGGQWSLERASRLLRAIQEKRFVLLEAAAIDRLSEIEAEGECEFEEPD